MTPWQPPKGTREIDRVIEGVGRVRLRTGTKDKRRSEAYDRLLDTLPLGLVRLLIERDARKRHIITLRELYDLQQSGQPWPSPDALRPLIPTMEAWVERPLAPVGKSQTAAREATLEALRVLDASAHVLALPELAKRLFAQDRDAGRASQWNHRKADLLAFLRDTFSKQHPLYKAVQGLPRLKTQPKIPRHPCTVAEAKAIRDRLGPKWGAQWWTLCLTGMEPKEYWVDGWQITQDGVVIHGQKRPARERVVPLLGTLTPPVGRQAGFAEALERASLGVTPMDARRSYQRWLDEARIPHYRQDAYAGHGPKSMRELYKWGDIRAWLADDARELRRHVGEPTLRVEEA